VIIAVGELLSVRFPSPHRVARLGGDEFAVLMLGTSPSDATTAADEVRRSLRARRIDGAEVGGIVSASIGIATITEASIALDRLLSEADTAMYRAKQLGGDQSSSVWEEVGEDVSAEEFAGIGVGHGVSEDDRLGGFGAA
jgi:diguanylate cyclase